MPRKYNNNTDPIIDPVTGQTIKATKRQQSVKNQRVKDRALPIEILKMHQDGIPNQLIATKLQTTPNAVSAILQHYKSLLPELGQIQELRQQQKDIIDALLHQAMKAISSSDYDTANISQLSHLFNNLYKASRLEHDKSTSNSSVMAGFMDGAKGLDDL
jgi:phage gp29-like protein